MGASLGEVCRVTGDYVGKLKKLMEKCLVSLLGRKLFRPTSYLHWFEILDGITPITQTQPL